MLYEDKEKIYGYLEEGVSPVEMTGILGTMNLPGKIYSCLEETLLARK